MPVYNEGISPNVIMRIVNMIIYYCRDIYLQHVELTAGKITLDKIDLDVEASKSFSPKTLSFLCRRVRPEYSTYEEILPSEKETLISDAFEFKISTTHVQGTVEMSVTLYSYPEPHEDVYLKTDQGTTTEPINKSSAISKIEVGLRFNERYWLHRKF